MQQSHRRSVTQHVQAYVLVGQRWTRASSTRHILGEPALEGVTTECPAGAGDEERLCGLITTLGQPDPNDGDRRLGERRDPLFTAFAQAVHVRPKAEVNVCALKPDELRGA